MAELRVGAGSIYRRIVASRVRSQLAYPASFALDVVAQFIGQSIELIVILVVFTQVSSLGGFSAGEVVLIYGLSAALIVVDFNFLRKHGTEDDAIWLATGIFVSIVNIFVSLLNILQR